ncbi:MULTISPECIES: hypothetical protein [Bacillus]|jgi:hypothetical protein|uniref:Uncharacterized protein YqcB n=6 Tax=Bacillus TaxID=1386 RepID=YQCB_BACSU|nr:MULTISPECIES: hypothetical protein [Bacillales]NP_390473.1 conserved phage protein of unknown function; skin element [Bacillus subtilis subsp. subtilis str. 168]P45937.1 RecName: Full=Uncharacterized protein YqcB [Bacillus subtilis subsp. subtilis str. 168]AOL30354.1 hypothetical protein BGM20_06805 [Alkalicoccobacillus gibsonii]MCI3983893.1 hypothetical protein [Bacillus vallismortis]MCY7827662.1 hypothetical protein [Bacillus spizizenii]POO76795.1 hypothetical protein C1T30_41315 [Bacill
MITQLYRERTAADLKNRISKVLLNGNETEIVELTIQGAVVTVLTQREEDIKHIKSVQILDDQNNVITERTTDLDVSNNRTLDFRITFEVV